MMVAEMVEMMVASKDGLMVESTVAELVGKMVEMKVA